MLIKLLPDSEKKLLLDLAQLLALSDKPLLWGGEAYNELTSDSDLKDISIQRGVQEEELIADLAHSAELHWYRNFSSIESQLIDELKKSPIGTINTSENRLQPVTILLRKYLKGQSPNVPSSSKIILFELILIALRDGHISGIEWSLIKEVQAHYQLKDFIFDDLLERAEALNNEISKTIALVLE